VKPWLKRSSSIILIIEATDLHPGNIVLEMPDLYGQPEKTVLEWLKRPRSALILTRDDLPQSNSLPKYVVEPATFEDHIEREGNENFPGDVKIIDFGGGMCHSMSIAMSLESSH